MRFWPTKRFWKRLAIGAVIVVSLVLIANAFMAWRTQRQIEQRLSTIRAAGDPASIADLAPKPIPDDENAAVHIERIAQRLAAFSKEYGAFFNSPIGVTYRDAQDRGGLPTAEQIDAMRSILDKYPDVEQVLAEAAQCDKYASRLDVTLNQTKFLEAVLANINSIPRTAARFLVWKMEVLVADGRPQEAVAKGIQCLRFSRLYEQEPGMVSFLVGIAMRNIAAQACYDALAAGPVSPDQHLALDEELGRHDNVRRLVYALKTDRAIGGGAFEMYGTMLRPKVVARIFGWSIKRHQVGVLDLMDEQLQLAEKPWHEVRTHFGPPDSSSPPSGHGVLADLLMPAIRATYHANARSLAMLRALRIFNALRQYREVHGREASGLEDLGLPKEATIDPYSGEPLKLKPTDDGWIIYSVMDNGVDDGGDFKELKDYGLAPPGRR